MPWACDGTCHFPLRLRLPLLQQLPSRLLCENHLRRQHGQSAQTQTLPWLSAYVRVCDMELCHCDGGDWSGAPPSSV